MSREVPWLTLGVLVLTGATTGAALLWPQLGTGLERDPAMLSRGEVWRFFTTWLVETDGWLQIAVNFFGLAVFGTLVEWRLGRIWWAVGYVVAGLAGEIAGLFWQPVGGGNSVAICGLIGLFSVWQFVHRDAPGPPAVLGTVIWLGLGIGLTIVGNLHGPALIAGFAVGALAQIGARGEAKHA